MNCENNITGRVIVVVYKDCQILDVSGPVEALQKANITAEQKLYDITLVAAQAGNIQTSGPVCLHIERDFESITAVELKSLDTLIIAGGHGVSEARHDKAILQFIQTAAKYSRRVVSICSGAYLLAEAGLLAGKRVTTHWDCADDFAANYADIQVDADAIYIRDGKFWTSAGITAGIDLALALIEEDHGHKIALKVARQLVVYLVRSGGQVQFSKQLKFQCTQHSQFRQLIEWIEDNPSCDLLVSELSARCAMSERNFTRRFTQETGITPARFVEQSRYQHARRYLEGTGLPLQNIADLSGFKSTEVLRRLFQREMGISPGDYRARFSSSIHRVIE